MLSALPKLVALGLLCCLCGCHSAKPITAASANRTPPSTSSKNSFDLATRDNSLVLLSDLLNDEKKLRLILLIKRETPELKRLVKGISNAASEGAKMLKARMKDDPAFKGAKPQLPPGEEATRKAIAKTKESLLLHTKGEEFEFQILLTQAEASPPEDAWERANLASMRRAWVHAAAVPSDPAIASTAIRTIAPHETGGNVDIKQLTAGATLYLPVYRPGGLFSVGDAHFAQGDGESCGTAVETSATFVAKFEVMKGEARRRNQNDPSYEHPGYFCTPEMGVPRRFYATTGIPVSRDGTHNESEDLSMAAKNALLNMIDYIVDTRGLSRAQAYCLTSVAVDLKVSQVVDVPNLIVSAFLPLDIFV